MIQRIALRIYTVLLRKKWNMKSPGAELLASSFLFSL